jgi:GTP pyrophosphokinase
MLKILNQIKKKGPEPVLIDKAFNFAKNAHQEQKRFSGQDYIFHPLRVALFLAERNLDPKTIAAALLHDVPDDTQVSLAEIEKEFGKEIAFLVKGVSKLSRLRYPKYYNLPPVSASSVSPQVENLRKMFFAMAVDLRIILIKLADRLHNMETLKYVPKDKQKRFALETLEIFAPIADRLGMGEMKAQLENLAFPYLYPKEYQWLMGNVKEKYAERENYLKKMEPIIREVLKKEGIIPLDIHSRAKAHWSLYKKLLKHNMNFEEIHDLVALRIIVKDLDSCYKTLGILHKHFKPLVGKIQDFIALPKPNGYQSLHTTCFCLEGKLIEIQIRTQEMHEAAENGICAHWAYKEKVDLKTQQKRFLWVQQLKDWQKEISGTKEFFDGLKFDFFKDRIFVFTPKGDIIDLPEGACPIDFAYHIHTEVGNHCSGVKINGRMAQVSTILKNGDVIEILLDNNKKPSRDWLKFAKTNLARSQIKKEARGGLLDNIKARIPTVRIAKRIFKEKRLLVLPKIKRAPQVVLIGGETGISFSFAKCCNPEPGDKIKAFITKANKAAVHKISCQNLKKVKTRSPQKIIKASWKVS